jgi:hypothetical protein
VPGDDVDGGLGQVCQGTALAGAAVAARDAPLTRCTKLERRLA